MNDSEESAEYHLHRTRKTKLEADRLEDEKKIRAGHYMSVDDFELKTERTLVQLKSLMADLLTRFKELGNLSADKEQELENVLIDGYNRIASIELD